MQRSNTSDTVELERLCLRPGAKRPPFRFWSLGVLPWWGIPAAFLGAGGVYLACLAFVEAFYARKGAPGHRPHADVAEKLGYDWSRGIASGIRSIARSLLKVLRFSLIEV